MTGGGLGRAFVGLFMVAWIAIWGAGTIFLDSMAVRDLLMQEGTRRYLPANGRIIESKVDVGSDSDGGTTYEPSLHYLYAVDDHLYDGHEWRHGTKTSNRTIANEWVSAYPAGSEATVYYDPRDPQRAVLMRGLTGSDLFMFVFLIPFNVIALGSWHGVLGFLRSRLFPSLTAGLRIVTDGGRTRVRLPERDPLWWALGTAALLAFAATFVVGFAFRFAPPLSAVVLTLATIGALAVATYLKLSRPLWAGEMDLTIDEARRSPARPLGVHA